jgi:hypothetical protein
MTDATLVRRSAATLLAIVGGGLVLYAWYFVVILVVDPILTWPQRVVAVVAGAATTAGAIAGVRALLGLKVASLWLSLPPAVLAVAVLSLGVLTQLLNASV